MKNTKVKQQIFAAEVAGRIAFKEGKKRVPAHDANLMEIISSNQVGESIKPMKAWYKGWDTANLEQ